MFVDLDIVGITDEKQGWIIKSAVDLSIVEMLDSVNEIVTINVYVSDEVGEADAVVDDLDDNEYDIILNKSILDDDVTLFKTVCHECVHIKQYISKELEHVNLRQSIWRGYVYNTTNIEYEDLPWEQEAFKLEEELYQCYATQQQ